MKTLIDPINMVINWKLVWELFMEWYESVDLLTALNNWRTKIQELVEFDINLGLEHYKDIEKGKNNV